VCLLVAWPGNGTRTVGLNLADLTGAALLDDHLINDLCSAGQSRRQALPQGSKG
jgi:hypothetical protein